MSGKTTLLGVALVTSIALYFMYPRAHPLPPAPLDSEHVMGMHGQVLSLEAPEGMVYDLWHHFMARYMRTYADQQEQEKRF